ncbi:hypothetical protein [Pontibaca methylaminivorans]|uniref:Peptidase inhibitor I78 family protein n=1 Tax=Pontibaca methylaminivorans TaxID=515897 RepID=A0A1R3WTV4_9RHOB|nr:hypothetical protein [Pontibaca methylaminivorans]SIT81017.1 hypothetical protein SAMN05421849_1410 [Pontibaca methylaminivorans]
MRPALGIVLLVPLLACSGTEPAGDPADDGLRARQEAACTAAITEHIRQPPEAITSRRVSETGGRAQVEARDGDRLHICDVDAAGTVLDYRHPRP